MTSLLLRVGSLLLSVLEYGLSTLTGLPSLLRVLWGWVRENMLKRTLLLIFLILLIMVVPRGCNVYEKNIKKGSRETTEMGIHSTRANPTSTKDRNTGLRQRYGSLLTAILPTGYIKTNSITESISTTVGNSLYPRTKQQDMVGKHGQFGVEFGYPKEIAPDFEFYRLGTLGFQLALPYFIDDKVLSFGGGINYNLKEVTHGWTQNTSLFLNYSPHTIYGGIRIAL